MSHSYEVSFISNARSCSRRDTEALLMSDCRSGNVKCQLGYSCKSIQISGQAGSNIYNSQQLNKRSLLPILPLAPGQFDLMIIGDRPFAEDDDRDLPFQDEPSELITDFLIKAGFDLTRVYFTKLVKCRPKPKVKPTVTQFNTCRDEYLRKEIELIQPKVVILVGAEALRAFNLGGNGSINSIHGKVFEANFAGWDDGPLFKVIPTVNPAVFLYRPNDKLRARVQHDYLVAKSVLDGKPLEDHFVPDWHLINTPEKLEWLAQEIEKTNLIGFDSEYYNPLGRNGSPQKTKLLCIQFAWGWNNTAVIPIYKHNPEAPTEQEIHALPAFGAENHELLTKFMKRIMENPNITKAIHNFKGDDNQIRFHYGVKLKGYRLDTMVMKHLMDENPPSDLKFLCDLEFSWGDYSAKLRDITGHGKKPKATFDKVPDDILWPYGATDALGHYRLAVVYADRLKNKHPNLWKFYQEESHGLLKALAKCEYKGQCVNKEAHDTLFIEFETEQKNLLAKMRGYLSKPDFNPSSNPQVIQAFFGLGVKSVDLEDDTASSGYRADKNKLTDLAEKKGQVGIFATDIMTYRNRTKMISTYLVNVKEDMDYDGRLRYTFFQAGPVTGRLSNRMFQQMMKVDESKVLDADEKYIRWANRKDKPVMRDMFCAPPGYKYIYGDFSQIELWILAILSQDKEMLRILNGGGDLHRATAYEFLCSVWSGLKEEDIIKFNRTEVGKRVNFGLAYGSEGHALVKTGKWKDKNGREKNFTWDMLNQGMERWKQRFTGVGQFIDLMPDIVRSYGCVATNVFGRERHFGPVLNSSRAGEIAAAERECINFFIQSAASCLTNRTIIRVDETLDKYDISDNIVCLVNTVHDSVAYEVRDDYVDWFVAALGAISMQPWPQLHNNKFKMDIGLGETWTDAEMTA